MKKPSIYTIHRAKATLFGRVLCRLFGEQTGAVMMEYVVIGVLVVAAAVGIVTIFGETIVQQVHIMIVSIVDGSDAALKVKQDYQQKNAAKRKKAIANGAGIGNRENN